VAMRARSGIRTPGVNTHYSYKKCHGIFSDHRESEHYFQQHRVSHPGPAMISFRGKPTVGCRMVMLQANLFTSMVLFYNTVLLFNILEHVFCSTQNGMEFSTTFYSFYISLPSPFLFYFITVGTYWIPISTVSRAWWLPHLPHLKRSIHSIDLLSEGQGLASRPPLPHSNTSICVLAPQPRPYWISFTSSVDQTSRPIGSLYSCSSLT
jgi:hypothetical protein